MLRWVVVSILLVSAACSSGPHLTDDGRSINRVSALVKVLERAYQQEDLEALLAGTTPDMPGREAMQEAAQQAFARYARIELAVTIDRIHLDGPTATVFVHWDGRWAGPSSDAFVRQGAARFVVASGTQVLVSEIVGDNPFAASSLP